jgi:hypothetical protein
VWDLEEYSGHPYGGWERETLEYDAGYSRASNADANAYGRRDDAEARRGLDTRAAEIRAEFAGKDVRIDRDED